MIETIVALVMAPLWLAMTRKKASPPKRGRQSSRPEAKPKLRKRKPTKAKPPTSRSSEPVSEAEPTPPPSPPPAPVQAPGLFSPLPGEALDTLTPNFRWFYVGGASHYQLVWSVDTRFHKAHILLTTQTAASLPPEQALDPEATYNWRVRAGNEGGWGPWSAARSFRTPSAP